MTQTTDKQIKSGGDKLSPSSLASVLDHIPENERV
jgi:hypothetical protein